MCSTNFPHWSCSRAKCTTAFRSHIFFSSLHPPHWYRGWNGGKAWKNGRKVTKNFSYPWFWQFLLVKSRVFCFLLFFLFSSAYCALSEEGIVGKRVPLPHNPRFVLSKTLCRFVGNDVLFSWKRRVVLLKLTCRFIETDVLFSIKGEKSRNPSPWNRNRKGNIGIVKIPINTLSRARTRTLLSRVFAFLLSQVSQRIW